MKRVVYEGYLKRVVYEGYFCHSEDEEESYGYDFLLSDKLPIRKTVELYYVDGTDELIIPPEDATVVIDIDNIFDSCKLGKKYRITVEEMPIVCNHSFARVKGQLWVCSKCGNRIARSN